MRNTNQAGRNPRHKNKNMEKKMGKKYVVVENAQDALWAPFIGTKEECKQWIEKNCFSRNGFWLGGGNGYHYATYRVMEEEEYELRRMLWQ